MMRQAPNYKDWLYKEMAEDFGVKMLEDGVFRIIEEPLLTPSGKLIGRRFHMEMDVYWAGYDVENE